MHALELKRIQARMMANSQRTLASYIELYAHIDPNIILTYQGSLIVLFRISGLDFEGADLQEQRYANDRFAKQLQAVDKHAVIYSWMERRPVRIAPTEHGGFFEVFEKHRTECEEFFENRIFFALEFPFASPVRLPFRERVPHFIAEMMEQTRKGQLFPFLKRVKQKTFDQKSHQLEISVKAMNEFIQNTVWPTVNAFRDGFQFLKPKLLGHQDAFEALLPLFNPSPAKHRVRQTAPAPINAMLECSNYEFDGRSLSVDRHQVAILSLKTSKNEPYLTCSRPCNWCPFPLVISSQWRRIDDSRAEGLITRQRRSFKHSLKLSSPKESGNDIKQGFKDQVVNHLDHALTELKNEGGWFGTFSLFIMIVAPTKAELDLRRNKIRSIFYAMGCVPHDEDMGLIFAWASMAPGSYHKYNYRKLVLSQKNYSDWAPIWTLEQGMAHSPHYQGEALSHLVTHGGNLYHFNLSHSDNLNFLALGKIGSGKSFFLKYHMIQYHKYGPPRFWIHTLGSDYNDLARICKGSIIELGLNGKFPINLYCLEETMSPRYLDMLLGVWRCLFSALGHEMTEDEEAELTQKLSILFLQDISHRNNRALHNLVGPALKKLVHEFIWDTEQSGRFGRLFDGRVDDPQCISSLSSFTVIDYKNLGDNLNLSRAAMSYVTYLQDQVIYDPALKGVNKFCWFDEGHKIIGDRDSFMWRYLNKGGDTWRKENCSLGFITQKLSDLRSLGLEKLLRECCSQFLFFPNPGIDEQAYLETFDLLNPQDVALIKSIQEKREVFFVTSYGVKKVLQLKVDTFTRLVLESNPKITQRKHELMTTYGFPENIHRLIEELQTQDQNSAKSQAFGLFKGD